MQDTTRSKTQVAMAVALGAVAVIAFGALMSWHAGPAGPVDRATQARVTPTRAPAHLKLAPAHQGELDDPDAASEFTFDRSAVPTAGDAPKRAPLATTPTAARTLASSVDGRATPTESVRPSRPQLVAVRRDPSVGRPRPGSVSPTTPPVPTAPQARTVEPRTGPRPLAVTDARPTFSSAATESAGPVVDSPRAPVRVATPVPTGTEALAYSPSTHLRDTTRPTPVWVSLAGVAPHIWPLHAWAPPRRREPTVPEIVPGDDQLPYDPLALAMSLEEGMVARWVQQWICYTKDRAVRPGAPPLDSKRLSTTKLASLGRSIGFVEGELAAIPWYGVAVAALQNSSYVREDAATIAALRMMAKPLFDARHFAACERVYARLVGYYPRGADETRKIEFVYAETLYKHGNYKAALLVLDSLVEANRTSNDLSVGDEDEMAWIEGLVLNMLGRRQQAVAHFRRVATNERSSFALDASAQLIRIWADEGKHSEARRELSVFSQGAAVRPEAVAYWRSYLDAVERP